MLENAVLFVCGALSKLDASVRPCPPIMSCHGGCSAVLACSRLSFHSQCSSPGSLQARTAGIQVLPLGSAPCRLYLCRMFLIVCAPPPRCHALSRLAPVSPLPSWRCSASQRHHVGNRSSPEAGHSQSPVRLRNHISDVSAAHL